eukprot:scaffold10298_cov34-Phaeocystis_antarctica.AAC.1
MTSSWAVRGASCWAACATFCKGRTEPPGRRATRNRTCRPGPASRGRTACARVRAGQSVRMCEPCTPDAALLEAVRGLRVTDPDLGFKPLLAKLRAQQPDLGAATKEVREALTVLKAESEAAGAAAAAPPAAVERGAPSN